MWIHGSSCGCCTQRKVRKKYKQVLTVPTIQINVLCECMQFGIETFKCIEKSRTPMECRQSRKEAKGTRLPFNSQIEEANRKIKTIPRFFYYGPDGIQQANTTMPSFAFIRHSRFIAVIHSLSTILLISSQSLMIYVFPTQCTKLALICNIMTG